MIVTGSRRPPTETVIQPWPWDRWKWTSSMFVPKVLFILLGIRHSYIGLASKNSVTVQYGWEINSDFKKAILPTLVCAQLGSLLPFLNKPITVRTKLTLRPARKCRFQKVMHFSSQGAKAGDQSTFNLTRSRINGGRWGGRNTEAAISVWRTRLTKAMYN